MTAKTGPDRNESSKRIRNHQYRDRQRKAPLRDDRRGALLHRGFHEVMAVEIFSAEREKDIALFDGARVRRDGGDRDEIEARQGIFNACVTPLSDVFQSSPAVHADNNPERPLYRQMLIVRCR